MFLNRKRAKSSGGGGGGGKFFQAVKQNLRRLGESISRNRIFFLRLLPAIPILWVLFDFVSFSFGTLPLVPSVIRVEGAKRLADGAVQTEIVRKLRTTNAENLIEVDLAEVSAFVLQRIPALKSARITTDLGRGTMTVAVVERNGIAAVQSVAGELDVDRDGALYPALLGKAGSLPEVSGLAGTPVKPGRNLFEHPAGAGVLRILIAMDAPLGKKLKHARVVRPDLVELQFSNGLLVKADPATFPDKVSGLQNIFFKIESDAKRPSPPAGPRDVAYIDVRFQQDVIRYASPTPVSKRTGGIR